MRILLLKDVLTNDENFILLCVAMIYKQCEV